MRQTRRQGPSRQESAAAGTVGEKPAYLAPDAVITRIVAIDDYTPHPRNYNGHPDLQLDAIGASLRTFGQPRPIVVWRRYIIAGHGVTEAARRIGWTHLRADILPEDYPEHLALAYLAADNELGRLADPDEAALAAILQDAAGADRALLAAIGYSAAEFEELLARVEAATKAAATGDPEPRIGEADQLGDEWQTAAGQLWKLGDHRLLCADSTKPEAWRRLMDGAGRPADLLWTDPPYGVDYSAKNVHLNEYDKGARVQTPIEADDLPRDALTQLWTAALTLAQQHSRPGAAFYICGPSGDLQEALLSAIRAAGWSTKKQVIWVKNNIVIGLSDYHYRHEPIIYGWKAGAGHTWTDEGTAISVIDDEPDLRRMDKKQLIAYIEELRNAQRSTVVRVDKPHASTYHPTTKPTRLVRTTALNNTIPGDLWIEPFAGAGTTLLAAEQTGRRCRAMEKHPPYVAVTLQLYLDATGDRPRLIEEAGR